MGLISHHYKHHECLLNSSMFFKIKIDSKYLLDFNTVLKQLEFSSHIEIFKWRVVPSNFLYFLENSFKHFPGLKPVLLSYLSANNMITNILFYFEFPWFICFHFESTFDYLILEAQCTKIPVRMGLPFPGCRHHLTSSSEPPFRLLMLPRASEGLGWCGMPESRPTLSSSVPAYAN